MSLIFQEILYAEELDLESAELTAMDIVTKFEGYCAIISELSADDDKFTNEINRLTAKRKTIRNRIKYLKDNMKTSMTMIEQNSITTPVNTIKLSANPVSVIITDKTIIPEKYFTHSDPTVNLNMIKSDIKNGVDVDGCKLESTGVALRIR